MFSSKNVEKAQKDLLPRQRIVSMTIFISQYHACNGTVKRLHIDLAHECWSLLNEPCPPQPNAIGHCHNICFKCLVYLVNEHSFLIQGIELWFPGMRAKTITKWEKGKPQSRVTEPMFLYSWFWGVFSLFHEVYQIITQSPPPLNICLGLGGWVSLTSLYPFEIKMAAFFVAMTTCMICGQTRR